MKIKFYDIFAIEKNNNINYVFHYANNQSSEQDLDKCQTFVDPSYDSIFKNIFASNNMISGITQEQRVVSLLNSIIFPDNSEKKKFISAKKIFNESNKMRKDSYGCLKFDISMEATIQDDAQKKI